MINSPLAGRTASGHVVNLNDATAFCQALHRRACDAVPGASERGWLLAYTRLAIGEASGWPRLQLVFIADPGAAQYRLQRVFRDALRGSVKANAIGPLAALANTVLELG